MAAQSIPTELTAGRIAVIGAGLAGLSCARAMQNAGLKVVVFEKSRGLGGRLATRRPFGLDDPIGLDHGAPQAEPSSRYPETAGALQALGLPWGAAWPDAPPGAALGAPGMSDLVRGVAQGLNGAEAELSIVRETEIVDVAQGAEDWLLRDASGASHGPFDGLVAAAPAAQSRVLLGAACPESETEATYAPVMTVLAVFDPAPVGASDAAALAAPLPEPLSSVWRIGAKPGRRTGGREAWVAHASRAWSEAHQNTDRDVIAAALLPALRAAVGLSDAGAPAYLAGHRWLYGVVERAVGRAYWLSAPEAALPGPLGCCGDWRLGPTAGDALASGRKLGEALAVRLLG